MRLLEREQCLADLAEWLGAAAKTVDHHVSAVLAKLKVPFRAEALALTHKKFK
jgi:DNA-binding NarL/FixJ family response regulator